MNKLFLLTSLFLPVICLSQVEVSSQIYGLNMPIELDLDTTYNYILDRNQCYLDENNLFGVEENAGCTYMNSFPYLYFYHQFSVNCCTDHFYQIQVIGESIFISKSDTGESCLCGLCTYTLTFSDQFPERNQYHIQMPGLDTIVSKTSSIIDSESLNSVEVVYSSVEDKLIIYNKTIRNQPLYISLFSLNGVILFADNSFENKISIDTKYFINSIYILRCHIGSDFMTKKILIQK